MAGIGSMAAWIAGGAAACLLLAPATARACDRHQTRAATEVQLPVQPETQLETTASAQAQADAKQPAAKVKPDPKARKKPAQIVAETCSCDGPGSCTCKKGQCKCKKCGGGGKYRMIESLRAQPEQQRSSTRRDASAGVFI